MNNFHDSRSRFLNHSQALFKSDEINSKHFFIEYIQQIYLL